MVVVTKEEEEEEGVSDDESEGRQVLLFAAVSALLGVSAAPASQEAGSQRDALRVVRDLSKGLGEFCSAVRDWQTLNPQPSTLNPRPRPLRNPEP